MLFDKLIVKKGKRRRRSPGGLKALLVGAESQTRLWRELRFKPSPWMRLVGGNSCHGSVLCEGARYAVILGVIPSKPSRI